MVDIKGFKTKQRKTETSSNNTTQIVDIKGFLNIFYTDSFKISSLMLH